MASFLVNIANRERYRRIYAQTDDKLWLEFIYREYLLLYSVYRWRFIHPDYCEWHYDIEMLDTFRRILKLEDILFSGVHLYRTEEPLYTINRKA